MQKKIKIKPSLSNLRVGKVSNILRKEYSGIKFSRKKIVELVKDQQKQMKKYKTNVDMMITVLSPDGGWKAGKQFKIDQLPNIMSNLELAESGYMEWSNVEKFKLYSWRPPEDIPMFAPRRGGANDKYNNCLFICICNSIGKEHLQKAYQTPWKFKKNVGLEKCDEVPFDLIPMIEDKINAKINVKGNYEYISPKKFNKTMTVVLNDGHYTLETHKKDLMKYMSFTKQKPLINRYNDENENYDVYDGKNRYTMTREEIYKIKTYKSEYYLFNCNKKKSLKSTYKTLIYDRDKLFEESKGKIDLHTVGGNVKNCFLKLLSNDIRHMEDFDEINKYEETWLIESSRGALICGAPCDWTDCHVVDKNSAYSHAMVKINYPVKQGSFEIIDDSIEFFKYGVYRCVVHPTGDKMVDRLFNFSKSNFYTHYDLEITKILKMKFEMIQDGNPNFLNYSPDKRKRGVDLFGKTINKLYEMKQNKVHLAKDMMSRAWGGLVQMRKMNYIKGDQILPEGAQIKHIEMLKDGSDMAYYSEPGKQFLHKLGRIKPFLLAYARLQMVKDVYSINEFVIRVATDSIASTKPIEHLTFGTELGEYKHEDVTAIKIINCYNNVPKK